MNAGSRRGCASVAVHHFAVEMGAGGAGIEKYSARPQRLPQARANEMPILPEGEEIIRRAARGEKNVQECKRAISPDSGKERPPGRNKAPQERIRKTVKDVTIKFNPYEENRYIMTDERFWERKPGCLRHINVGRIKKCRIFPSQNRRTALPGVFGGAVVVILFVFVLAVPGCRVRHIYPENPPALHPRSGTGRFWCRWNSCKWRQYRRYPFRSYSFTNFSS